MVCRCSKCGRYINGKVDAILFARIVYNDNLEDVKDWGSDIAEGVEDWTQNELGGFVGKRVHPKLGNLVGKTVSDVSRNAVKAASQVVGHYRSMLHGALAFNEYDEYYCFECTNSECGNRWIEKKENAVDKIGEFYAERIESFSKCTGKRYLVINPDAKEAYYNSENLYMLPYVSKRFSSLENHFTVGEVYISHPVYPDVFYPLETYRMKVLEDEIRDLVVFLTKLGAASIKVTGMTDYELSESTKKYMQENINGDYAGANFNVEAKMERENNDYSRIRSAYRDETVCEIDNSIILDEVRFNGWRKYNRQWESILECRRSKTIKKSVSISTEILTSAKKREWDRVCMAYSDLSSGGNLTNEYVQESISRMKEARTLSFNVEVVFHSLNKYKNPEIQKE